MPLKPAHRAKLDSLVAKMQAGGESDEYIQSVVDDFKAKYTADSSLVARLNEETPWQREAAQMDSTLAAEVGGVEGPAKLLPWIFGAAGGIVGSKFGKGRAASAGLSRGARFGAAIARTIPRAVGAAGGGALGKGFTLSEQDPNVLPEFLGAGGEQAAYEVGGGVLSHVLGPGLNRLTKAGDSMIKGMGWLLERQNRKITGMLNKIPQQFDPLQISRDVVSQIGANVRTRAVTRVDTEMMNRINEEFLTDPQNQGMLSIKRLYEIRKDADLRARQLRNAVRRGDPTGDLAMKQRYWSVMANVSRDYIRAAEPKLIPHIAHEQSLIEAKDALATLVGPSRLPARMALRAAPVVGGALVGAGTSGQDWLAGAGRGALLGASPEMLVLLAKLLNTSAARSAVRQVPRGIGIMGEAGY